MRVAYALAMAVQAALPTTKFLAAPAPAASASAPATAAPTPASFAQSSATSPRGPADITGTMQDAALAGSDAALRPQPLSLPSSRVGSAVDLDKALAATGEAHAEAGQDHQPNWVSLNTGELAARQARKIAAAQARAAARQRTESVRRAQFLLWGRRRPRRGE